MRSTDPVPARGTDSDVRPLDLLRDAAASLRARHARTAALVSSVAVAVGLAVVTVGLSQSASAQVSDRFDAVLNTEVTVHVPAGLSSDPFAPTDPNAALESLAGVSTVGTLVEVPGQVVQVAPGWPTYDAKVMGMSGDVVGAARLAITWARPDGAGLAPGRALIGMFAADAAEIGPLELDPVVTVGGRVLQVAGIITSSYRDVDLLTAVVLDADDLTGFGAPTQTQHLLVTVPGAAPQVARQAPLLLRPTAPTELQVDAPVDPQQLRAGIETDLRLTLLVLSAVAMLAAALALAGSMSLSVSERAPEYGLRRAVGARPGHVVASVLTESVLLGLLGGILGLVVGLVAILVITLLNRWLPVFDLRLAPAAVATGIVVAALAGCYAAWRAARIQPASALRAQ